MEPTWEDKQNGIRLYLGDCLDILPQGFAADITITDPPYGTTQCSWDVIIPFETFWDTIDTSTKKNAASIVFGSEPFSSRLRLSNIENFKYDWVWDKIKGTNFLNAKKQPLRCHELISVFYPKHPKYSPQMSCGHDRKTTFRSKTLQTDVYGDMNKDYAYDSTDRYPKSIITFSTDTQNSSYHPTQKPVSLLKYMVNTYTSERQIVLDPFMGSGTTGVASALLGRGFVGVEKEEKYFEVAVKRISDAILMKQGGALCATHIPTQLGLLG